MLGDKPWGKQVDVMESIRDFPETAVASCHGAGKSFIAGRCVLWFLAAYQPSIVITTAPTDRQVKGILWKEIRLAHTRAKFPLGGKLLTQELKFADDWWAWGFTAPEYDPDRFQGFHEANILVVVDEACGVSEQIFEGIDGVLSSENSRLLMIGNPTDPSGRFGHSFKYPGVKKIRISAYDTPNFTEFGITEREVANGSWERLLTGQKLPYPKLVTPQWVATRFKRWGADSPLYKSRVLGEFPDAGTDSLIPLSWVEAAQQRKLTLGKPVELGVDVARFGDDETIIAKRSGSVVRVHTVSSKEDTMQTTGRVVLAHDKTGATRIKVDEIGVGAGVVDRLFELEKPVYGLNSGSQPHDTEHFLNARAEWYWQLRERFEKGTIDLDEADEELAAQLSNLKYKVTSNGKIQVESKEDMKKRGVSSPDRADAVMLSFAEGDIEDAESLLAGDFPTKKKKSNFDLDEDEEDREASVLRPSFF